MREWHARVGTWCDTYRNKWRTALLVEIDLQTGVYVFDQSLERVMLAYGLSRRQLKQRDKNRMRGFPDVNIGVRKTLVINAFECDRGHFLGHASGGELDINLFPQRRELNRGWSQEGKVFRSMEQYAATHPGTFVYHRAIYNDKTWIPDKLEYGLLIDDSQWWVETFSNKNPDA